MPPPTPGAEGGPEHDVRPRAIEVRRRRRGAVDRLGEHEALGVVGQSDRAAEGGYQIAVERTIVEGAEIRVPDHAPARLQEARGSRRRRWPRRRPARPAPASRPDPRWPRAPRRRPKGSRPAGARARARRPRAGALRSWCRRHRCRFARRQDRTATSGMQMKVQSSCTCRLAEAKIRASCAYLAWVLGFLGLRSLGASWRASRQRRRWRAARSA